MPSSDGFCRPVQFSPRLSLRLLMGLINEPFEGHPKERESIRLS